METKSQTSTWPCWFGLTSCPITIEDRKKKQEGSLGEAYRGDQDPDLTLALLTWPFPMLQMGQIQGQKGCGSRGPKSTVPRHRAEGLQLAWHPGLPSQQPCPRKDKLDPHKGFDTHHCLWPLEKSKKSSGKSERLRCIAQGEYIS